MVKENPYKIIKIESNCIQIALKENIMGFFDNYYFIQCGKTEMIIFENEFHNFFLMALDKSYIDILKEFAIETEIHKLTEKGFSPTHYCVMLDGKILMSYYMFEKFKHLCKTMKVMREIDRI